MMPVAKPNRRISVFPATNSKHTQPNVLSTVCVRVCAFVEILFGRLSK